MKPPTPTESKHAVEKALADHVIMLQLFATMRSFQVDDGAPIPTDSIAAARKLMAHTLPDHYACEETLIFPQFLADHPSVAMVNTIDKLRQDHRALRQDAQTILTLLEAPQLTGPLADLVRKLLEQFAIQSAKHAARENKLFPSLI